MQEDCELKIKSTKYFKAKWWIGRFYFDLFYCRRKASFLDSMGGGGGGGEGSLAVISVMS